MWHSLLWSSTAFLAGSSGQLPLLAEGLPRLPVGQVRVQLCSEQPGKQEHKFPAENAHCRVLPACTLPRLCIVEFPWQIRSLLFSLSNQMRHFFTFCYWGWILNTAFFVCFTFSSQIFWVRDESSCTGSSSVKPQRSVPTRLLCQALIAPNILKATRKIGVPISLHMAVPAEPWSRSLRAH